MSTPSSFSFHRSNSIALNDCLSLNRYPPSGRTPIFEGCYKGCPEDNLWTSSGCYQGFPKDNIRPSSEYYKGTRAFWVVFKISPADIFGTTLGQTLLKLLKDDNGEEYIVMLPRRGYLKPQAPVLSSYVKIMQRTETQSPGGVAGICTLSDVGFLETFEQNMIRI
ncbi:uncharacterized protein LOC117171139 [Belonocnema kinseyi]|uniref:uncharacterized protein LOC117171139 n=1 Tax=Belonocnema kinseyi TaxID=2817044 RepID=UPI00143CC430|nr:uncharacterized protein LOC117171139 [Belonocnema kinseyi]